MNFYTLSLLLYLDSGNIVALVIAILGSGGLIGGVIALLKLRPEAGQILVTTAQGVVVIQTGVIETLQREVARLRTETEANQKETEECKGRERQLQARVFELERQAGMHNTA